MNMHLSCTDTEIRGFKDFVDHEFDLLGSRDVIGHVTIGLGMGTFLLVINDDHVFILHRYGDTGLQRFRGQEFDFLGPPDVIGHVTIGLGICSFLFLVHWNHASILHRYGDIGSQRYWGHDIHHDHSIRHM